jgi:hypothetical protein
VNTRRIVGVGLIVLVVLLVALLVLRGRSDSGDESAENVPSTTTTFPEPPGGAGNVAEETEGTLTKTSFSTTDEPGTVLDSYLADFARIGWTTLNDERAGDVATLTLQGGNRYAAIRAVNDGETTAAIVCTGVDQTAVFECAAVAAPSDGG